MDKIIKAAEDIGLLIQNDERYKKYNETKVKYEADKNLQNLLKKLEENNQNLEENISEEEFLKNQELKNLCFEIFNNENMKNFQDANKDFKKLIDEIFYIIEASSQGENPKKMELNKDKCVGSCSCCSGCH